MIKKLTKKNDSDLLYLDGEEIGKEVKVIVVADFKSIITNDMKRHTIEQAKELVSKGQRINGQIHYLFYLIDEGCFARTYSSVPMHDELASPVKGKINRLFLWTFAKGELKWSQFRFQPIEDQPIEDQRSIPLKEFEDAHLEDIVKSQES